MEIRNCESYSIFKKSLLKFIRTIPNSVFRVADTYGIKLLPRLRVGFLVILEYINLDNFQDTINPLCSCSVEIQSTSHFFLRCQNFITPRTNLLNELRKLDSNILNIDEIYITKLLLCGDNKPENNVLLAITSFYEFHTLYKAIWRSPDATFFLNICLLAIFLSFYLSNFTLYAFIFYPSLHGHSKVMRPCF